MNWNCTIFPEESIAHQRSHAIRQWIRPQRRQPTACRKYERNLVLKFESAFPLFQRHYVDPSRQLHNHQLVCCQRAWSWSGQWSYSAVQWTWWETPTLPRQTSISARFESSFIVEHVQEWHGVCLLSSIIVHCCDYSECRRILSILGHCQPARKWTWRMGTLLLQEKFERIFGRGR